MEVEDLEVEAPAELAGDIDASDGDGEGDGGDGDGDEERTSPWRSRRRADVDPTAGVAAPDPVGVDAATAAGGGVTGVDVGPDVDIDPGGDVVQTETLTQASTSAQT